MTFILSLQRDEDTAKAFDSYRKYIAASRQAFPPHAYELATSEWYFDFRDHRCPHDAWLESLSITEPASGDRSEHRHTSIRFRLLGAYHDGHIEFFYPLVFRYSLSGSPAERGLGDWRYDEFRISSDGHLVHEIEWAGSPGDVGSRWIIEASDVEFQWIPK
jgi:hypothetical protein